ncbi:Serine/threonine-protein kinase HT1, partial [Leucoagaricus sp. SymC.cos]
ILHLLCKLTGRAQVYPNRFVLTDIELPADPFQIGGFADIYQGKHKLGRVCVKVIRVIERECQAQLLMAFAREIILWAHMSHENVLPFYGVYAFTASTQKICLVSPLMDNGSLREYLKKNPAIPRLPLVQDVVNGLLYLHQSKIVHGDLKAVNVVVSDDGRALITDFGLSYIAMTTLMDSTKVNTALTLNWTAPELICDETSTRPTKASDIWSFGCLCYEVFTGLFPYYQYKSSGQVVLALTRGQPPKRPPPEDLACDQLDDRIWELLVEACWKIEPRDRLPISHPYDLPGILSLTLEPVRSAGSIL